MKRFFCLLLLSSYHLALCQGPTLLDKSANPGETIVEFDNRNYSAEGSYYLFDDWTIGNINLRSGANISDHWINYNSENDMLEIKTKEKVKVVPLLRIDHFIVEEEHAGERLFMPCRSFILEEEVPLAGLCEIIDTGYYGLLVRYSPEIKEATYVPALDMGKKEEEIIIKKNYFLLFGANAFPIPKKKQEFISLYEPHKADVGTFIKDNKLNHRKDQDLRIILNYVNGRDDQLQ
jgi:hypothetical protein